MALLQGHFDIHWLLTTVSEVSLIESHALLLLFKWEPSKFGFLQIN
jgi:hypothetical protein